MIKYIKEPTDLQCGQAVLAMLTEKNVEDIIFECKTDRETTLSQMKTVLENNGFQFASGKLSAEKISELPNIALLSLETPRCWHWSLCVDGIIYDPEHGILTDFPVSNRKFYWKIIRKTF